MRFLPGLRLGASLAILVGAWCAANPAARAAVTISSRPTQNMTCTGGVCTPTAAHAVLNATDLANMLASGNVQVNTGSGGLAKDIVIDAAFTWANGSSLSLDAWNSIAFERPVAVNGTGAVSLTTNDGGSNGVLDFGDTGSLSFLGTANSLTINGAAYTLIDSVEALQNAVFGYPSGNFALSTNYDASQDGTYSAAPIGAFEGTLEGLGNAISNLKVSVGTGDAGFFGNLDGSARDLRLVKVDISGTVSEIGGLTTYLDGTLYGDSISGVIHAKGYGIVGGLAAWMYGKSITDCKSSATILAGGHSEVGGLAGYFGGTITNSSATGAIKLGSSSTGGGLVGYSTGSIVSSFATGNITAGQTSTLGGLVGRADKASTSLISNAYALGSVAGGSGSQVGGLIGYSSLESNQGSAATSYATGVVSAPGGSVGGLVGSDKFAGKCGCFSDLYWDMTTSGITNPGQGAGNTNNDPGLTGLTTQQLQAGLPQGFDPAIWAETPKINNGLPYLINNPPK
jgi:hypothetical protein